MSAAEILVVPVHSLPIPALWDLRALRTTRIATKGARMKQRWVSTGELESIALTRAMLGAGLGLLIADQLTPHQRRMAGWGLFSFGVLSTIPIIIRVFGGDPSRGCGESDSGQKRFSEAEYRRRPPVRTGFE
jgi:hypothetical protein